jgi:CO/xanthine dehydrogenase FAD-binding subunit
MRANVQNYDLTAQPDLASTLALLAEARHTPIAGGTELMVALSAGRLPTRPLLSIHHLAELRFIRVEPATITLGSGTTFTDLRRHPVIAADLPLLAHAASWTGSIANQNRGTLGGNIVNASPAADSPPALLVYDAALTLISAAGTRTVPYAGFHTGYKTTILRPDELLHSIAIPRQWPDYQPYIRKVGTRNAQAISKVAIAALTRVHARQIQDIRIAGASLREMPARCFATESALRGRSIAPEALAETIALGRTALASEIRPIDDIRSTAAYRTAVALNILEELLTGLQPR